MASHANQYGVETNYYPPNRHSSTLEAIQQTALQHSTPSKIRDLGSTTVQVSSAVLICFTIDLGVLHVVLWWIYILGHRSRLLVVGCWLLAVGCWLLRISSLYLVIGFLVFFFFVSFLHHIMINVLPIQPRRNVFVIACTTKALCGKISFCFNWY